MADINVERKGPSIWPWIIGLIVLALLIWALVELFGGDEEAEVAAIDPVAAVTDTMGAAAPVTEAGATAGSVPGVVQEYMTTCAPREPGQMSLDHQYTSDCIQRLVASVEAVLQNPDLQGVDVQAQLQDARQKAQQLTQSANASQQHANMTRDAFVSVATLIDAVQNQRYSGLNSQVDQLQQAAQSVQPTQDLLSQRDAVQSYFRQAGDVLNSMATTTPSA